MKKILAAVLALCMLCTLCISASADEQLPLEGKVVILFTNDMHGRAQHTESQIGYSCIAQAKKNLKDAGAEVFLLDAGDAFQGAPIVNISQGAEAVQFMNMTGYDAACPGNHELDWGIDNFLQKTEEAEYPYVCSNIVDSISKETKIGDWIMLGDGDLKIGVFGLDTPEAETKVNPEVVKGIDILGDESLMKCAQTQVDEIKEAGAQLVVCLGHLGDADESAGNRSIDVIDAVEGIDLFIDGHSHTYLPKGEKQNDTLRVSTGCNSQALGYAVYDIKSDDDGNSVLEFNITGLFDAGDITSFISSGLKAEIDEDVDAYVESVMADIQEQLGTPFAKSDVALNGDRNSGTRTQETAIGDFCADAILWKARQLYSDKTDAAIIQGGGIRAGIEKGDISMMDLKTVFPFDNTVACLEIPGKDLLEVLEAATFSLPDAIAGFPQVSGIEYSVDTTVEWEQGEQYSDSTFYAPKTPGARVTIKSIGEKPFDEDTIYTIATSNFLAAGGDQYYAMKYNYVTAGTDTGVALEDALIDYITDELGGVIGEEYAEPQGRIEIVK